MIANLQYHLKSHCMKHIALLTVLFLFTSLSHAQRIKVLVDSAKISIRGLSVVNDTVIWASGSKGTVVKSTDGGKNFKWLTVKGYEQRDFRDIEAFDAKTAVIIAVDSPAIILKTRDSGRSWIQVFRDDRSGMFLDAMDFDDKGNGMVVGDPIDGRLFIATSTKYGDKWIPLKPEDNEYTAGPGEA